MILEEEKQAYLQAAAKDLEQVRQQTSRQHSELHEEQSHLQREVIHLEEERHATASTIPETDLHLYEHLRKQRLGVAVAKVVDRACSACGSVLSTALLATARTPSLMGRCETCGRILYGG
jgi:hypothetical protein